MLAIDDTRCVRNQYGFLKLEERKDATIITKNTRDKQIGYDKKGMDVLLDSEGSSV